MIYNLINLNRSLRKEIIISTYLNNFTFMNLSNELNYSPSSKESGIQKEQNSI